MKSKAVFTKPWHGRLAHALLLFFISPIFAATPRTFCNPVDLDYGINHLGKTDCRHGADPVIVLYNNRYYLFSTWDKPGYRVSDDLLTWSYIPFAPGNDLAGKTYTAAGVTEIDGYLYYTDLRKGPGAIYRTKEPDTGKWEKVADLPHYADPCLFLDPKSNKVFLYHGLEKPIKGVELDRKTFTPIADTETQLMPTFDPTKRIENGWEVCTNDNSESSKPMRGNKTFFPCREGSWMTFFNNRYYLQFASPGTTVPGYADGLLMGDSPLGPFTYSDHSPISHKDSGFITSAGHGCLFQDRDGNWWRAVTMLVGVNNRFERRIGLFPAGFDEDGTPFTRTDTDLPIDIDDRKPRWALVLHNARATASTTLDDAHAPSLAADEDIRTWWSAQTGNADEWLQLDLGRVREIHAFQANLAEQGTIRTDDDKTRFSISASADGNDWQTILDHRTSEVARPHAYLQLDAPVRARYLKIINVFTPGGGNFAVSDLRAFGPAEGKPPEAVAHLTADRDPNDRRKVALRWKKSQGATAYLIRYGIDQRKLYQHHLVRGDDTTSLTLYTLNNDPQYYFRIDATNEAGSTVGIMASAK